MTNMESKVEYLQQLGIVRYKQANNYVGSLITDA